MGQCLCTEDNTTVPPMGGGGGGAPVVERTTPPTNEENKDPSNSSSDDSLDAVDATVDAGGVAGGVAVGAACGGVAGSNVNPLTPVAARRSVRNQAPSAHSATASSFRSIGISPQPQQHQQQQLAVSAASAMPLYTPTGVTTPSSLASPYSLIGASSARLRPAVVHFSDTVMMSVSLDSLPITASGGLRLFSDMDCSQNEATDAVVLHQQQHQEAGCGQLSLSSDASHPPLLDASTRSVPILLPMDGRKHRDAIARRRMVDPLLSSSVASVRSTV